MQLNRQRAYTSDALLLASVVAAIAVVYASGCSEDQGTAENGAVLDVAATGDTQPDSKTTLPDAAVATADVDSAACAKAADCPTQPCLVAACNGGQCKYSDGPPVPCSDGNPCTLDDHCAGGACTSGANVCDCLGDAECVKHDDGNQCNGELYCDLAGGSHKCRNKPGSVVTCDTDKNSQCKHSICDPADGICKLTALVDGTFCNDDEPCTVESWCADGKCVASDANWCACQLDADCAKLDDEDACNGVFYCNKQVFPWTCGVNPQSVVTCSAASDTACAVNTCDPATGKCAAAPVETVSECLDGLDCKFKCDDGNKCTVGDTCAAGVCVPGDVNLCSCKTHEDCASQEDGDLCNGVLYCDLDAEEPACKLNPATVVTCETVDDTACVKNTCVANTGLCEPKPLTPGTLCDDGDGCTANEICKSGLCQGGKNICPCQVDADCAAKDDGDLCNGTLYCDQSSGACEFNPASIVTCSQTDDTACAKKVCEVKTGDCKLTPREDVKQVCVDSDSGKTCKWTAKQAGEVADKGPFVCDDGESCTEGDVCKGGDCAAGTFTCTCNADVDCAPEEDGDLCNGTLYCNKALNPPACVVNAATKVTCPTVNDSDCVKNTCSAKTGKCTMQVVDSGAICSDGDSCTKNDVCLLGKCQPGTQTCECQTAADCLVKDDGNPCNGVPYCDKTKGAPKCVENPNSAIFCTKKDDTACLKNICNPANALCQMTAMNTGGACDDGSKCTAKTSCDEGECKGELVDCGDGNACTVDSCDKALGCVHKEGAVCDDGNSCTVDLCDAKTGKCAFDPKTTQGKSCDGDGSGCTVNDTCDLGQCITGPQLACTLPTQPCEQAVCLPKSPTTFSCVVATKKDGDSCELDGACTLGSVCKTGKCVAGDIDKLFDVAFEPEVQGVAHQGRFNAVAAHKNGFIMAGAAWPLKVTGKNTHWWIQGASLAGKAAWSQTLASPEPHLLVGANDLDVLPDGSVVAAGVVAVKGQGLNVQLARYGADGTFIWSKDYGQSGSMDEAAEAIVAHPGGGMTTAGWRGYTGKRKLYALRLSSTGQVAWSREHGGTKDDLGMDLVRLSDDSVLVAGHSGGTEGVRQGWLVKLDLQGKVTWERLHGNAFEQRFTGLVSLGNGRYGAAGWRMIDKKPSWWLMQVNGLGLEQWQRGGVADVEVDDVAAMPAGLAGIQGRGLIMTGRNNPTGGNLDHWLMGTDNIGNQQWDRGFDGGGTDRGRAVVVTEEGLIATAGERLLDDLQGKRSAGVLLRTDPWGHATCKGSGECASKKPGACDDGSPCTADLCEAIGGCKHLEAGNLVCELGGCAKTASCQQGQCIPLGGQGKLHVAQYAFSDLTWSSDRISTVTPAQSGGAHILWRSDSATDRRSFLGRVDVWSKLLWSVELAKTKISQWGWAEPTRVLELADGRLLIASYFRDEPYERLTTQLRYSHANGTAIWTQEYGQSGVDSKPHDLVVHADDTWGVVGTGYWPGGQTAMEVMRVSASSKMIWRAVLDADTSTSETGLAAVALKDGSTVVAGNVRAGAGPPHDGLVVKVDGLGKPVWRRSYGGPEDDTLAALAAHPAGGFVAAGRRVLDSSASTWWLLRTDEGGAPLWQRAPKGVGQSSVSGVAITTAGGVAISGTATLGASKNAWLLGTDSTGTKLWQQNYKVGNSTWLGAGPLAAFPDGGFALAAGAVVAGIQRGVLIRTDAWGNADCVGAGKCAGKTPNDCDDSDACTLDTCATGKGCQHSPASCDDGNPCAKATCNPKSGCQYQPVAAPCDDGDACTAEHGCQNGACVSAKDTSCDDGNQCTQDPCLAGAGCAHKPLHAVACKVENGCSPSATCNKGTCDHVDQGVLYKRAYGLSAGSTTISRFDVAVPAKDGGLWLMYNGIGSQRRVMRLNKFGGSIWNTHVADSAGGGAGSLIELAGGGALVAWTYRQSSAYLARPRVQVLNSSGLLFSNHDYPYGSTYKDTWSGHAYAVTPLLFADNTQGAVSTMDWLSGYSSVDVVRAQPDGKQIWRLFVDKDPVTSHFARAGRVVADDGTLVAGHRRVAKAPSDGLLLLVSKLGKEVWRRTYDAGGDDRIQGMAVAADGGYVLGGATVPAGASSRWWLVRTDSDGKELWQRSSKLPFAISPRGVAVAPGGGIVLAGEKPLGATTEAWLMGADSLGFPLWQRTHKLGAGTWLGERPLASFPDGGLAIAGGGNPGGVTNPVVIRTDPWGHAACLGAGPCGGKKATDCDDGDPCTIDLCEAAQGCVHKAEGCEDGEPCTAATCIKGKGCAYAPVTGACEDNSVCTKTQACKDGKCQGEALNCDDGSSCTKDVCDPVAGCQHEIHDKVACKIENGCSPSAVCDKGTCVHADQGLLYSKGYGLSAGNVTVPTFDSVSALQDGGLLVTYRKYGSQHRIIRLNKWGTVVWDRHVYDSYAPESGGSIELKDGSLFAVWPYRQSAYYLRRPVLQGVSASGTVTFTHQFAYGSTYKDTWSGHAYPATPLLHADGTHGIVGTMHWLAGYQSVDVIRAQPDGKPIWRTWIDKDPGTNHTGAAGIAQPDGHTVVAGSTWVGSAPADGLLLRLDAFGKLVWQHSFDGGANDKVVGMAEIPGGGWMLGGSTVSDPKVPRWWLVATDGDGKELWQRSDKLPAGAVVQGMGVGPDGRASLAGTQPFGIGHEAWLRGTDRLGFPQWQNTLKIGTTTSLGLRPLAVVAGGGLALVGGGTPNAVVNPVVFRTDPWGNTACQAAGKCAGLKVTDCDDGDPCTVDICDPSKGCLHNKETCNDGEPCTAADCDAVKGCLYTAITGACEDNSVCTKSQACKEGKCQGPLLDCDDGSSCTKDVCDPVAGCKHEIHDKVACKIENGCSPSAFCDKGTCVHAIQGLLHARPHNISTTGTTLSQFDMVVPIPEGGAWSFYRWGSSALYVVRFDKWGAMAAKVHFFDGYYPLVRGARLMPDGKLMVSIRYRQSSSYLARAHLMVLNGSAGLVWQAAYPVGNTYKDTGGAHGDAAEILDYPDQTFGLVGGLQWLAGWHSPQVIRLQGNGKLIWRSYVDSDKATNLTATAGLSFQDGSTVVAGSRWIGQEARDGMLAKVDNAGKTVWVQTYDGGGDERALHLVNRTGGGFALAGTGTVAGKPGWWWAHTDSAGKLLWQRSGTLAEPWPIQGVSLGAEGLITVSATADVGIVKEGRLAAFDASGKQQWGQTIKSGPSTWLSDYRPLVHTADGGLLVTGGTSAWGAPNPMIVRASPWGQPNCAIASACAGLGAKDCGDGKACTADLCDAAKGCQQVTLSDGIPCADGKACKAAVCQ